MKKIIRNGKILLAVAALSTIPFNSCTNLDETLYDKAQESDYFRDESEVITGVAQVYTTLYGLQNHGSYFSAQEVNANEAVIPQRGGDWEDGRQWIKTYLHTQDGTEDCYKNAWNFLFTGVANCNWAIYNVNAAKGKGVTLSADYIAEIRGLRALYYYWLLDGFGNVPIVDTYPNPANFLPKTNSRAEVYAFVEKELNEVSPLLSRQASYGRFNYYAAQSLLAHLYMNAGVYKGASEWDKALTAARNVTGSGSPYTLTAAYKDNFTAANQGSTENIFVIPYDQVLAKGFNLGQMTLHYESQKTFKLDAQPWNGYCAAQEFYDRYDATDARKANMIAGPQFAADGVTPLKDPAVETDDPDGPNLNYTPQINALFPNAFRQAGARIGKFEFATGATQDLSNDFPILRLADIKLLEAEALARKAGDFNNADALAIVKQIRSRTGLPVVSSITEAEFLNERLREMFYEGWTRSDLIRFGKFNNGNALRPTSSAADRTLWPIPVSQINANPNLEQNPGY